MACDIGQAACDDTTCGRRPSAPKCSLSAQRKFYGAALPAAFTQGRNNSYLAHVGLELKG